MNDSADMTKTDIAGAAEALSDSLRQLESSLDPVLASVKTLNGQAREAEVLSEDRVKLAAKLDEALEARKVREADFETLSRQTREELDATITALQHALASQGGSDG